MTRGKRPEKVRALAHPVKIRWAARLRPVLLARLYDADAAGIRDEELCNEVGMYLYARCRTFHQVVRSQVTCPRCETEVVVAKDGETPCPRAGCDWFTDFSNYWQSVGNHYAWPGRATEAFESFHQSYPHARTYADKIILIDQLIHRYHVNLQGTPGKSVASKLLEGNKKAVVAFLDALSARDSSAKDAWRRHVATTIDARALGDGQ